MPRRARILPCQRDAMADAAHQAEYRAECETEARSEEAP